MKMYDQCFVVPVERQEYDAAHGMLAAVVCAALAWWLVAAAGTFLAFAYTTVRPMKERCSWSFWLGR